jgi:hypothetical protein
VEATELPAMVELNKKKSLAEKMAAPSSALEFGYE